MPPSQQATAPAEPQSLRLAQYEPRPGCRGAEFVLDQVSVRFGAHVALDAVDLRVRKGEMIGFVGPSGSGKTTLLRLWNGTVQPSSGRVVIDGQALSSLTRRQMREVRSSIGFVHQELSLVPNLRVVQNVIAGRLSRYGLLGALRAMLWSRRAMLAEVDELLARVGIADKIFERTDKLSGGQKQRVAVARALFQQPCALLADEPVSAVDPARARDTIELLTKISQEECLTLCVSLHNLELAREFFPRLVGLRAGRIVFDAEPEQIGEAEFRALYDLRRDQMLADRS